MSWYAYELRCPVCETEWGAFYEGTPPDFECPLCEAIDETESVGEVIKVNALDI